MIDWRWLASAATLMTIAHPAAACTQWRAGSQLVLRQNDGWTMANITQTGERLTGSAQMTAGDAMRSGRAQGRVGGSELWLRVQWNDGTATIYEGAVQGDGSVRGTAYFEERPQARTPWTAQTPLACAQGSNMAAAPPPMPDATGPGLDPNTATGPGYPASRAPARRSGDVAEVIRTAREVIDAVRGRPPAPPPAPVNDPDAPAPAADPAPGSGNDPGTGFDPNAATSADPATDPAPDPASGFDPGAATAPDPGTSSSGSSRPANWRTSPGAMVDRPVQRPSAGSLGTSADGRPIRRLGRIPPRCASGFVWREARPNDYVCVTPDARARVARENSLHAQRVAPTLVAGNAPCLNGFVWREAFAGDRICVQPYARALAARENQLGPGRVAVP